MKDYYEKPEVELEDFEAKDVLTESGIDPDNGGDF